MKNIDIGQTVGQYRLDALLGRGGMGMVFRATDLRLGRPVALKVIAPELSQDAAFRARFTRESKLAAAIDHPNVVPIYEAGEDDGLLFIAMRYVPGTDLRELVSREGRLRPERIARIVSQVGDALDAAHGRGLVHRDVKPGNVLLTGEEGREHAYLTDFGLTKHVASQVGLTRASEWVGTADYVSPEQIEGRRVDARADIYSLGCVLYEGLTGQVPFAKETAVAKLFAHLKDLPPAPTKAVPSLPAGLDGVVERAMRKDPAARYPSAGDLARAASAAISGSRPLAGERTVAVGDAAPGETVVSPVPATSLTPREEAAPAAARTAGPESGEGDRAAAEESSSGGRRTWPMAARVASVAVGIGFLVIGGIQLADAIRGGGEKSDPPPPATIATDSAKTQTTTTTTGATAGGGGSKASTEQRLMTSWEPNLRIGPLRFNRQLDPELGKTEMHGNGGFTLTLANGAVIFGTVEKDPADPRGPDRVRSIYTESSELRYRGMGVGTNYETAQYKLGSAFDDKSEGKCPFLSSYLDWGGDVGPVTTQLFYDKRSKAIYAVEMLPPTSVTCPG